ncbi:MAG: zinc ribbon domain-containing protein [Gammaproteobacteria bacterium]|jgi:putative FmdB family regulatory protein|nr:zinc ribbon domain-containing protein [Gammaproteobacteria bacterium]
MPIYEYACKACGHQMEAMQKMSDPVLTDCPSCGKAELQKLISAAGFRLKGGGWYETDFKSGSKKNVSESSAPAPACAAGGCGGACGGNS